MTDIAYSLAVYSENDDINYQFNKALSGNKINKGLKSTPLWKLYIHI